MSYSNDDVYVPDIFDFSGCSLPNLPKKINDDDVPEELLLDLKSTPGFFFGKKKYDESVKYVGMPQGEDGNILVIGGSGSGKSSSIAKPTLVTFQGAICVTDIKGELSDFYADLYQKGIVTRPYIIFNPMKSDSGIGYDPFYHLRNDGEENLDSNVWELVLALHPIPPDTREPFWAKTEQSILAAVFIYYYNLGLSFSETIANFIASNVIKECEKILHSDNVLAKSYLGSISEMKLEHMAAFDVGLRNDLVKFATDPFISNAFRDTRENAPCFTWNDLDNFNIFLRVPEEKIEQWSGAINLMYTQLIRHLECRPDKYSTEGANNVQTLLLMDEFSRFGKLEVISNAISTLRSRSVNICLIIQSMAQLDKYYCEHDKRIIFDNCQYKVILRANDAETQAYLSRLIGSVKITMRSATEHLDDYMDNTGYSHSINESWELRIQPHELAMLKDILLLTPYGFCHVEKIPVYENNATTQLLLSSPEPSLIVHATATIADGTKDFSEAIIVEATSIEIID